MATPAEKEAQGASLRAQLEALGPEEQPASGDEGSQGTQGAHKEEYSDILFSQDPEADRRRREEEAIRKAVDEAARRAAGEAARAVLAEAARTARAEAERTRAELMLFLKQKERSNSRQRESRSEDEEEEEEEEKLVLRGRGSNVMSDYAKDKVDSKRRQSQTADFLKAIGKKSGEAKPRDVAALTVYPFSNGADESYATWKTDAMNALVALGSSLSTSALLQYLQACCKGDAASFLRNSLLTFTSYSVEEVWAVFDERFGSKMSYYERNMYLLEICQERNESVDDYYKRKLEIFVKKEASREFFEGSFFQGLQKELKPPLARSAYEPEKFDKVLKRLRAVDERRLAEIRKEDERRQEKRCHFCKKIGHLEADCLAKKKKETATSTTEKTKDAKDKSNVECYHCKKRGHIAPNCPEKKKTVAALQREEEAALPVDEVKLGGGQVRVIYDSGAEVSLVKANVAEALNLDVKETATKKLKSFDQKGVAVRGKVTEESDGEKRKYYVVDEMAHDAIVGYDILMKDDEAWNRFCELRERDHKRYLEREREKSSVKVEPKDDRLSEEKEEETSEQKEVASKIEDPIKDREEKMEIKVETVIIEDAEEQTNTPDHGSEKVYKTGEAEANKGEKGRVQVVRLESTIVIPPRTACWAVINSIKHGQEGLVEALPSIKNKVLLSKALVRSEKGKAMVSLLNPTNKSVRLNQGTRVGAFTPNVNVVSILTRENTDETGAEVELTKEEQERLDLMMSKVSSKLPDEERAQLRNLLKANISLFVDRLELAGASNLDPHTINTGDAKPIKLRAIRVSPHLQEHLKVLTDEMLAAGVIRESVSPWAFPVILVDKPDGSLRFCVDYRRLNAVTIKDAYPIPRVDEILDALSGKKYISTMDLSSGYWQIPLREEDKAKTAFVTRSGHFEFNVLPMGPTNSPATFQANMEKLLAGLNWICCLIYIDDIIVGTYTFEEHLTTLQEIFNRFKKANIVVKAKKCNFLRDEVPVLGHLVIQGNIKPNHEKIRAIEQCRPPTNTKQIQQFLGLTGYYRRFVPKYAEIAAPLTDLLVKDAPWKWETEQQTAFETLKVALTKEPILTLPDFKKEFILMTDASDLAIGAVLAQLDDEGHERVVAYGSKRLSRSQRKYSTTMKECLSIVYWINYYRCYLQGKRFMVFTDHKALKWLMQVGETGNPQLLRWAAKLQQYDMEIKYRPGKENGNADSMTREPIVEWNDELIRERAEPMGELSDDEIPELISDRAPIVGIVLRERGAKKNILEKAMERKREMNENKSEDKENKIPSLQKQVTEHKKGSDKDQNLRGPEAVKDITIKSDIVTDVAAQPAQQTLKDAIQLASGPVDCQDQMLAVADGITESVGQSVNDSGLKKRLNSLQGAEAQRKDTTITGLAASVKDEVERCGRDVTSTPHNQTSTTSTTITTTIQQSERESQSGDSGKKEDEWQVDISEREEKVDIREREEKRGEEDLIERVKREQREDHYFDFLFDFYLRKQKPTEKWQQILVEMGQFSLVDGILYFSGPDQSNLRLAVPKTLRPDVLHALHDDLLGGHQGTENLINKLVTRFWWPGMAGEAADWVRTCPICQARKRNYGTPVGKIQPIVTERRFQHCFVDIMGPLPKTKRGNIGIVTFMDHKTKWPEAFAIPDMTAATVGDLYNTEIICRYSAPEQISSDRGPQFVSELIQEINRRLSIEQRTTTAYHPQSNGMVERFNGTLQKMLSAYVSSHQKDWDEYLPYVLGAYRFSTHHTTGVSPFKAMFGREPNFPVDVALGVKSVTENDFDVLKKLDEILKQINANTARARERFVEKGPKKEHNFKLNDLVLLYTPRTPIGTTMKLARPWLGPYKITRLDGLLNIELQHTANPNDVQLVHVSRIKKYYQPSDFERQLTLDTTDPNVYEVDHIIDHDFREDGMYYKVRWRGYSKRHDSWVHASEFDARETIKEYERRALIRS